MSKRRGSSGYNLPNALSILALFNCALAMVSGFFIARLAGVRSRRSLPTIDCTPRPDSPLPCSLLGPLRRCLPLHRFDGF